MNTAGLFEITSNAMKGNTIMTYKGVTTATLYKVTTKTTKQKTVDRIYLCPTVQVKVNF